MIFTFLCYGSLNWTSIYFLLWIFEFVQPTLVDRPKFQDAIFVNLTFGKVFKPDLSKSL